MKRKNLVFIQVLIAVILWLITTISVFAVLEGTLISADSSTINIYPQPNLQQSAIGMGNVGNKVMILEQAYNNQGDLWYRIRLVESPKIEGWIADTYVSTNQQQEIYEDPYDPRNYYQLNQFN